jgi:spore coat protein W
MGNCFLLGNRCICCYEIKPYKKGAINMSDSQRRPEIVPNKIIEVLVNDVFSKHGIDKEQVKGKLSEEKKQMLKEMVEDLSKRVDEFVKQTNTTNNKK